MAHTVRITFQREFAASAFSPSRYALFACFFTSSAALFSAIIHIAEGGFWTLEAIWTLSVALPLPVIASIVTMPMFAGERAAGTYESLTLLPVSMGHVVAGKFMASFLSLCVGLFGAMVPWLLLCHALGNRAPSSTLLIAPVALLALHAFSWTALGTLFSSIARRPWMAASGTILAGSLLMLVWAVFSRLYLGGNYSTTPFPIYTEIIDAAGGRIAFRSIVFHVSFGILCLFAAARAMELRR